MRPKKSGILLLLSRIPNDIVIDEIYPPSRYEEIMRCNNPHVRAEKYFVWKLLEQGVRDKFGIALEELDIVKNKNGKWETEKLYFSISHSKKMAAVAISDEAVGVDIEAISRYTRRIETHMLTEKEMSEAMALDDENRKRYVIEKWTQKESIFKTLDKPAFVPVSIETDNFPVKTEIICVDGEEYALSVCGNSLDDIEIKEVTF